MIQVFTGLLLMTSYSPSSSMAWASVFYISHDMWYGWFIRGVHHFAAQAMVVLLALHLLQVLWAGAYRRPREFNWWFGMVLLFLTLAFSLTGYLLPWDQKGYWATKVATNIMGGRAGRRPLSPEDRGRRLRLREPDGHPVLRPARWCPAGPPGRLPGRPHCAVPPTRDRRRRAVTRGGRPPCSGPNNSSWTRFSARPSSGW